MTRRAMSEFLTYLQPKGAPSDDSAYKAPTVPQLQESNATTHTAQEAPQQGESEQALIKMLEDRHRELLLWIMNLELRLPPYKV